MVSKGKEKENYRKIIVIEKNSLIAHPYSYKITLTFTSCRKDEFTCADANCIPMESRSAVKYLHEVWFCVPRRVFSI